MSKDVNHSPFEFDDNPDFTENFYKNIDRVLSDIEFDVNDYTTKEVESSHNAEVSMYTDTDNTDTDNTDTDNTDTDTDNSDTDNFNNSVNIENKDMMNEIEDSDNIVRTQEDTQNDKPLKDNIQNAHEKIEDRKEGIGDEIDEELVDINASLAKQISEELEAIAVSHTKSKFQWTKIRNGVFIALGVLVILGLFLGFTKPGHRILKAMGGKIWSLSTNEFGESNLIPDVDIIDDESDNPEINDKDIMWNVGSGSGRKEENVYNILLVGEEAINSNGARGRTDLIIIATLNKNDKKVKLTSLMRDTLVQIPGYQDNKLNSAYEKGGIELLYKTIELNFDIKLDGCVKVNFESFEKIIDRLGGLEITLTNGEARYLNTTNYISKPQYRNVAAGKQKLNGNQVLGYSRIRHRAAITGDNNDYGRTDRHRIILNAVFDKYKTKSKPELATIMMGVLPMLTTDIDNKEFEILLDVFMEIGVATIEDLRIPADGAFTDNVKVRGMDVLIPDLEKNVDVLHKFIFGN